MGVIVILIKNYLRLFILAWLIFIKNRITLTLFFCFTNGRWVEISAFHQPSKNCVMLISELIFLQCVKHLKAVLNFTRFIIS